jgi:hypothetical protein
VKAPSIENDRVFELRASRLGWIPELIMSVPHFRPKLRHMIQLRRNWIFTSQSIEIDNKIYRPFCNFEIQI